jgi:ribonuclease BN (tRNA processing enzyme)
MHKVTFYPLGNAESIQIDLHNGQKILFDYANQGDPDDPDDLRIDLQKALKDDLHLADRDDFDVVAFTHLDDDHIQGMSEFFYLEHAQKYQGEGRIKIKTLWVPAAAIVEPGCKDEARILQAEAKHRLRKGKGIRVFSRPQQLADWLEDQGLTLEDRKHLITDAGRLAPEFSLNEHGVEFFIHSPFAHRLEDDTIIDRNNNALVVQVRFVCNEMLTQVLLTADLPHDALVEMINVTQYYKNDDRLEWDVIDISHHCSYLSLAPEKGKEKTEPVPELKWLFEKQAQMYGILVSPSKPIPSNDDDNQPPHRQAANYYRDCAAAINGEFIVTMEHPKKSAPEPLVITIDDAKATPKKSATSTVGVISSRPSPRAG